MSAIAVPEVAAPPAATAERGWRSRLAERRFWWWVGVAVLLAQFAVLMAFKAVEYQRFALSFDYSIYFQAWHQIGTGVLNPYSTVMIMKFWQNDAEFFMWPLALLEPVLRSGLGLLAIQQLAGLGAGLVALRFVLELHDDPASPVSSLALPLAAGTVIALLALDPWIYTGSAFDWHFEALYALFSILALRALWFRRWRQVALWAALTLLCGSPASVVVIGLGLVALAWGKGRRWAGLALVGAAVAFQLLITALHAHQGGSISGLYGSLVGLTPGSTHHLSVASLALGVLRHPGPALARLWHRRLNVWAVLAPSGLLGVLTPIGAGIAVPSLLEGNLATVRNFGSPAFAGFQMWAVYPAMAVGTAVALGWLAARRPRWAKGLAALLLVDLLGWFAVWVPTLPSAWLRVPPSAAAALSAVAARVPARAEVVVSQGVAGRFAGRRWMFPIINVSQSFPVRNRQVWFVFAPRVGVETAPATAQEQMMETVADVLGARLMVGGNGLVWAYRWRPPAGVRSVTLPADRRFVPAFGFPGPAGRSVEVGDPATWHVAATGAKGYVLAGDYWLRQPGSYVGHVELAATGPVNVECWNASAGRLLGRVQVPGAPGRRTVSVACPLNQLVPRHVVRGVGPFSVLPVLPPPGNNLELRVFSPGGEQVSVFTIWMTGRAKR